jgi:shikimate kinase
MPRLTNETQLQPNKYVLIGISNSGKSTIGKQAAEKLQIPFYNTDILACERLNLDNPIELFLPSNMMRFFDEKSKLLTEFAKLDSSAIIEIWPESVLNPSDVKVIKKIGTIIYIKREIKDAIAGVKKSSQMVLRDETTGKEMHAQSELLNFYAKELHHFEALADLTLDNNGSLDEAVEKLAAMIQTDK